LELILPFLSVEFRHQIAGVDTISIASISHCIETLDEALAASGYLTRGLFSAHAAEIVLNVHDSAYFSLPIVRGTECSNTIR